MPKPFVPAGTKTHYTPDQPVGVGHVRLDVDLDLKKRSLTGTATLSLTARRDDLAAVVLDAVEMTIDSVSVDGKAADRFDYDGVRLRIPLRGKRKLGEHFTVAVTYKCSPRRGLYFIGPDEHNPGRALQCWTQGQDEDSRHYWPSVDAPIAKATSEVLCTVPRGLTVLSNGDLIEKANATGNRTRWHYKLDFPHAAYLVSIVCGTFTELKDRAPKTGVDVYYYAPPGREDDARRSLARTPAMIDFFSERIGVPYPHRRYSQVLVEEFIFGGMENTSATTLTDQTLLDERAALDHDVEALVSHELAHQWWGDLLTCREWSEAWLNEGFATYFEYVWREHTHGRHEADVELLGDTEAYLGEAGKYQRPVVCRQYEEPIELFDAHLYDKGGRVLHMLRHDLGDAVFWRALGLYARRHARGSVETRDLARAVEETSGRNMDRFFAQWIENPGHPELACSWTWDDDKSLGILRVEQKQPGDRAFELSAPLWFELPGGRTHEQIVVVRERIHQFEVRLPAKPTQVIFDPGDVMLKTVKFEKPLPLWKRQLASAPLGVDRVLAARELGDKPEPAVVIALRAALNDDAFWAVRAAAARSLGKTRREDALDALLAARKQKHPRVRRAVAAALGDFRDDERAADALAAWAEKGDPSYFVEANAALSLGRTRSPRALAVLPQLFARPSFQDVIRTRALDGLGATGDENALPLVKQAYQPGVSFWSRRAAIAAAARLAEGTGQVRKVRDFLERGLDDTDFRVRSEAASGLVLLGDARAAGTLERALHRELDGRTRRRLKQAIADLQDSSRPGEQARKLSEEVERLRNETIKLRERVEKLEPAAAGAKRPTRSARPGRR